MCLVVPPPEDNLRQLAWDLQPAEDGMLGMYQLTSPDGAQRALWYDPDDSKAAALWWLDLMDHPSSKASSGHGSYPLYISGLIKVRRTGCYAWHSLDNNKSGRCIALCTAWIAAHLWWGLYVWRSCLT